MGKVLLPALLAVLISACAASAIELRSSNGPTDSPFGMSEVAMPEGVTKDKWKKIKADILAELRANENDNRRRGAHNNLL